METTAQRGLNYRACDYTACATSPCAPVQKGCCTVLEVGSSVQEIFQVPYVTSSHMPVRSLTALIVTVTSVHSLCLLR